MNFKSRQKHKRKADINGSWKLGLVEAAIKEKKKDVLLFDKTVKKRTPAKKKWPCKRNKGEHTFVIVPEHLRKHHFKNWIDYKCSACGKEEYRMFHSYNKLDWMNDFKINCCSVCGKEMVPDTDALDDKRLWDEHTFKYDCDCNDKNIRISIG